MKRSIIVIALCAIALGIHAQKTYNYLCAITELKVDTLASNTKNQYTLSWTQVYKNTAEYTTKPEGTYTTTVKLVINSDDRTLEGTYTTVGADPNSISANVNDQTINLVSSELYYGSTRRLLRTDSVSTFTIIKIDDTHYGISVGRLCFTAADLVERGKNSYIYNYCYAEDEILTPGISPKPFEFRYVQGEYVQQVYNYDMTVNGISVEHDDSGYGTLRYFLTLSCTGKNRANNTTRNYEVQLAIYPSEASIVGSFSTQGSGMLLYSSNSYVRDMKIDKTRYLANDSLSTIQIKSKGTNLYSFFGGTLTCTDIDANYQAVYHEKRIEAVHYYHFSDNDGQGIEFGWDESSSEIELTPYSIDIEPFTASGEIYKYNVTLNARNDNGKEHQVSLTLEDGQLDGTFTVANEKLSLWSNVYSGTSSSYVATGSTITVNPKSGNIHTISGNLLCENGNTYIIRAFDFEYGSTTGIGSVESQKSKVESRKVLRDRQMLIIREDKTYNAQGTEL